MILTKEQKLINQIREEISCCCSVHRYNTINELLNQMEEELQSGKRIK